MNNRGVIVGVSFGAGFSNPRAVIWQNGKAVDMNTLVSGNSSLYLLSANDINDEGVIAGQACVLINGACTADSETPAFVAIPDGDWDRGDAAATSSPAANAMPVAVADSISQRLLQRQGVQIKPASSASQ